MSGTTSEARPRGLDGVVAAQTRMSHVDGQNGVLIIGGYELKELAGKVTFEEAAHLLWKGRLPSADEKEELTRAIATQRALPETTLEIVREAAKKGAPPIDTLRMACATLSLDLRNPNDISPGADFDNAKMLVARFPTIVAAHTRISAGLEPIAPRTDLSLAGNFLYMVFGKEPDAIAAKALDTYWVTVIDHGMNASTFAARVIASTRSDMVSAVTGAIGALKGPLHGGAPGPVLDMLDEIGEASRAEAWFDDAFAKGTTLMGFGHRIYKVRDPRADVLKAAVAKLPATAGRLAYAAEVEKGAIAALRRHKPGRRLDTNVEYYTALLLEALEIPREAFTALFGVARTAGWCAHVFEQVKGGRIIRPQSNYVGPRP
jgi:citrate synthase